MSSNCTNYPERSIALIGTAGTGKTLELLKEHNGFIHEGVSPHDIYATTFRRSMVTEYSNHLNLESDEKHVYTLHALCLRLGKAGNENIVVEEKHHKMFCETSKISYASQPERVVDSEIPVTAPKELGNMLFDVISFFKNNMLGVKDIIKYPGYEELTKKVIDPATFVADAYQKWEKYKAEKQLIDFDDMLTIVYENKIMPDCKVMLFDEYQDFTPLQHAIAQMWSTQMEFVRYAGDGNQSIYGFWGASPSFFNNLKVDRKIVLDVTHRVPKNVWEYSEAILKANRIPIPAVRTKKPNGGLKRIMSRTYYDIIKNYAENTLHLVRINDMAKPIALALAASGIPFFGVYGWTYSQVDFYNCLYKIRTGSPDVTFTSTDLMFLVKNYPKDFFNTQKMNIEDHCEKHPEDILGIFDVGKYLVHDLFGHAELFNRIRGGDPLDACLGTLGDVKNLTHMKISQALRHYNQWIDLDRIDDPSNEHRLVSIKTIHGAKGGQENNVFLHTGITRRMYNLIYRDYSYSVKSEAARAEEARIFFVGASRTKENLFIVQDDTKHQYILPDHVW